jgi:hypothetical protein
MLAGKNRQEKTGCEEAGRKHRGRLGQGVASTAAGHEPSAATADTKRSTFGALQQDDAHQGQRDHNMNQ